jgi:hypothetical protein
VTSNQELKGQRSATLSPLDLKQIREAVSELRATSPKSVLADLVEEKIRALEDDDPGLLLDYAPSQGRRIFS